MSSRLVVTTIEPVWVIFLNQEGPVKIELMLAFSPNGFSMKTMTPLILLEGDIFPEIVM